MFKLPEYEITIHINVNDFSKSLESNINELSKDYNLRQSTEYGGRRDYHWGFNTWNEAVLSSEVFKEIIDNPNCILFEVHANYNDTIEPIVHKNLL